MGPDDVREVLREVRVLRRRQPFRQNFAARFTLLDLRLFATEELRRKRLAGDEMLHVAVGAVIDDVIARVLALLAADLREEVREAVVVVHRPAVERMIVTLRALDAHAHEDLRGVLGDLQGVGRHLIIVRRRLAERAAVGDEELAHNLVDRDVGKHLVAQPVEVGERRLLAELILPRTNLEQLGELHHPQVRELGPVQERLDEMLALGRALITEEALQLICHRQ